MIIVLFLKGVQLAKIQHKLSEIDFFYKNLNKKKNIKRLLTTENIYKMTKIKKQVI